MTSINTNISSMYARADVNKANEETNQAMRRLSSGLRINQVNDDVSGWAIANGMTTQIRGTETATQNASQGVTMLQMTEAALTEYNNILQRMSDLATQAANGTNSQQNRESIQSEIDDLLEQLDFISNNTSFNGINLFENQELSFQVGADVGQTLSVALKSVDTNELGSAATSGLSSTINTNNTEGSQGFSTGASGNALVAGDVVINGAAISASQGGDDSFSYAFKSSSAIAKVAAINASSDNSGVTATVNANKVEGTTSSANLTANTGFTIEINGVSITASAAGVDRANDLESIATVINENTGLTGVTASVVQTSDTKYRIDLNAEDGRNITIATATGALSQASSQVNASSVGLARAGDAPSVIADLSDSRVTYTGSYTLVSTDGSSINIDSDTGDIENAGFAIGSFNGQQAQVSGEQLFATTGTVAKSIVADDLIINNISVGPSLSSTDTFSSALKSSSAISKAAAINAVSDQTGVTAIANANVTSGILSQGTNAASASFTLNNVSFTFTTDDDQTTNTQNFVDAVNAISGQTGITAELNGSGFNLIGTAGQNIVLTGGSTASNADLRLQNTNNMQDLSIENGVTLTTYASITLVSGGPIDLETKTGDIQKAGFNIGQYGGGESGMLLSEIDVTTVEGAEKAMIAIDNAIRSITADVSSYAGTQNQFLSQVDINNAYTNTTKISRGAIVDANFALETSNFARSQVLQQASTAMLAQANASGQLALSLLG